LPIFFRVSRNLAVDDQPEISILSLDGLCCGNQFLLALSTELVSVTFGRWR